MAYTLKYNDVDITKYVIDIDDIYIINRNINFTPIASDQKFKISGLYTGTIQKNDIVKIYDTTISTTYNIWSGYVDDFTYSADDLNYTLTVLSPLAKLDTISVTYDNLHPYIIQSSSIFDYFYNASPTNKAYVQMLWLIKSMFNSIGYSIDISPVENTVIEQKTVNSAIWESAYQGQTLLITGSEYVTSHYQITTDEASWTKTTNDETWSFLAKHIYIQENMMYCLNQSVCANYQFLDQNHDNISSRITCFKLLSDLCSSFSFNIRFTSETEGLGYDLVLDTISTTNISYTNNYVQSRETSHAYYDNSGYTTNIKFGSYPPYYDLNVTGSDGSSQSTDVDRLYVSGDGQTSLSFPNHYCLLYRYPNYPTSINATGYGSNSPYYPFIIPQNVTDGWGGYMISGEVSSSVLFKNKIVKLSENYEIIKTTTVPIYTNISNAINAKLDLHNNQMLIEEHIVI